LCYGITTPEDAAATEIAAFHRLGGEQARNIPEDVTRLVVPFGSGNTATSLLVGIAEHVAGTGSQLRDVTLVGIGPSKWQWMLRRLDAIEGATGIPIMPVVGPNGAIRVTHIDLHGSGVVHYHDRVPWTEDGIAFHPTYEGKVLKYMDRLPGVRAAWDRRDDRTLFWIVGGEPHANAMERYW
jgi:hypothetical protein